MFLSPANVVCEGYVFTHVCHFVHGGGMCGNLGACMVALGGTCRGHAWLLWGVFVVPPGGEGMHGCSRGHAWLLLGGHACVVAPGGMHGCSGGHAWLLRGGMHGCSEGVCGCSGGVRGCPGGHAQDRTRYGDMVNEQAVRILLECILVFIEFSDNI